jgi:hypothetical protein
MRQSRSLSLLLLVFAVSCGDQQQRHDLAVTGPPNFDHAIGSSITPNSGPTEGGTSVSIDGHWPDYWAPYTVQFGSAAPVSATWINSGLITAVTPPHAAGTVNITVRSWDSAPTTRENAFTYEGGEEQVKIESVSGSWDVRPAPRGGNSKLELNIGIYDAEGKPIPNRSVDLTLQAIEGIATPGNGGHDHEGSRPKGSFWPSATVSTGETGILRVEFRAPEFSGEVKLTGTSGEAKKAEQTITVKVPGLVEFARQGASYSFQSSSRHSSADFYHAPGVVEAMAQVWADYIKRHQQDPFIYLMTGDKFTITAASLVWGGLYDYKGDWRPPHSTHRSGGDIDFDDNGAESDPQLMENHCAKFSFGGRPIKCELHNGNHFHAYVGPNR